MHQLREVLGPKWCSRLGSLSRCSQLRLEPGMLSMRAQQHHLLPQTGRLRASLCLAPHRTPVGSDMDPWNSQSGPSGGSEGRAVRHPVSSEEGRDSDPSAAWTSVFIISINHSTVASATQTYPGEGSPGASCLLVSHLFPILNSKILPGGRRPSFVSAMGVGVSSESPHTVPIIIFLPYSSFLRPKSLSTPLILWRIIVGLLFEFAFLLLW